ncbi:ATP-grasp domain-containing protein [Streptomyces sp. NBC_01104]|uniref:ATP-grasp domain-containing protein n=1 Tax=Streptomyces sp. NBC_01104 TaxID=2903750 RepID=UPI0038641105|nr:ATP-grasp domain-containing protein [Streptomyces sp. NBC_01104]
MPETPLDVSQVTHVAVGLSVALLADLEPLLPARSVLVLDEPDTIKARDGRARAAAFSCVAGLVEAPTQDEAGAGLLGGLVARPPRLKAVIPALEYGVVAAAALADAWGAPGAGTEAARLLRDKALLREASQRLGIDQPAWEVVEGPDGVDLFRGRFGGRCVVKPANRQASLGVRLLDRGSDSAALWAETAAADETRMRARYALPPKYLVEQRLDGPEFSVEALVQEGEVRFANVTAKSVQHTAVPVEMGHVVPAELPSRTAESLLSATRRLMKATGFRTGVVHAEWILHEDRPHLVECAGRLPGDSIDQLINLSYACNLTEDYLHLLEGQAPVDRAPARRASAIRFLASGPGLVTAVEGAAEAARAPGVVECEVDVEAGTAVGAVTSSWDRLGHVIAVGDDPAEAAARAVDAAGLVRITVEAAS